jgi:Glu-tRNA(Gln) amidotransferase subunit E-like FAD-binding protein
MPLIEISTYPVIINENTDQIEIAKEIGQLEV